MPTSYSSLYSRPFLVVRFSKLDMSTLVKSTLMVPIVAMPVDQVLVTAFSDQDQTQKLTSFFFTTGSQVGGTRVEREGEDV